MRALNDNVIVSRIEAESVLPSGIVIPGTAKEKTQEGRVVAIGSGRILEMGGVKPLDLKEGDRILFEKFVGHDVKIDGQDYLIIREYNVLCVLD